MGELQLSVILIGMIGMSDRGREGYQKKDPTLLPAGISLKKVSADDFRLFLRDSFF